MNAVISPLWSNPQFLSRISSPVGPATADGVDRFEASANAQPANWMPRAGLQPASQQWLQAAQTQADAEQSPAQERLDLGLQARDWGVNSPQVNPNTGDGNWSNYSLGWARRAMEDTLGRKTPLLRADNTIEAYQQIEKAGRMRHGKAPAGAIVFVPNPEGGYKVGFVNPDGRTYRTTVPSNEDPSTIGDRPLPKKTSWMMPPKARTAQQDDNSQAVKKHKVPRYSQLTIPHENRLSNCGPTSLAMVTKGLGLHPDWSAKKTLDESYRRSGNHLGGRRPDELQDAIHRPGSGMKSTDTHFKPDVEWVRKRLEKGELVLAEGNRKVTYPKKGYEGGSHWIVITGIDKDGNFLINDPSTDCRKLSPKKMQQFFDTQEHGGAAIGVGRA